MLFWGGEKILKIFGKRKSESQEIVRTGRGDLFTSLPGFPLEDKMKVIQHGALTSGDLRGFYSDSVLLPGTVINRQVEEMEISFLQLI